MMPKSESDFGSTSLNLMVIARAIDKAFALGYPTRRQDQHAHRKLLAMGGDHLIGNGADLREKAVLGGIFFVHGLAPGRNSKSGSVTVPASPSAAAKANPWPSGAKAKNVGAAPGSRMHIASATPMRRNKMRPLRSAQE